jgi:hypothetical protein
MIRLVVGKDDKRHVFYFTPTTAIRQLLEELLKTNSRKGKRNGMKGIWVEDKK